MKNRRYHRGIGRSPFEAMFGRKMEMGNEDGKIPSRAERGLTPMEDETFPSLTVDEEVSHFLSKFLKFSHNANE